MTISASKAMLWRSAAVALSAVVLSFGFGAAAQAGPPGDNGTVKIHATGTPVPDRRNEPHVCGFYLDAFGFDGKQSVSWVIKQHAPTRPVGKVVRTGQIVLAANGTGRTAALALPDGHYKLFWTFAGEHGKAKHKVFWVKCAAKPSPSPSHGGKPPVDNPPSNPGKPSPSPSASQPAAAPVANPSASPSAAPAAVDEAGGSLPVTGAPLAMMVAVAVVMIGAGVLLLATRGRRLFRRS